MQTDRTKFEDFIFKNWKTVEIEHKRNGDTVYYKGFTRKGIEYWITARFAKDDGFCWGYLTDENGTAIINGKGFDVATFTEHLKLGLKSI